MAASKFARPAPTVTAAAKPRAKVKATVVEESTTLAGDDDVASGWEKLHAQVHAFAATIGAPSWKRVLLSATLGLLTYGGIFYGCMALVDAACFAAIAYTGVGFIAFMIAFIGIMVSMIGATTAGMWVYRQAMMFEYTNVKARVSGWFGGVTGMVTSRKPTLS